MKPGRVALLAVSAPWGIGVGWTWLGLALALGFARAPRFEPGLVLTAEWRMWVARRWRWSTTIGRAIIYHPDHRDDDPTEVDTRLERHERKHVWQVEDMMLLSLIVAALLWLSGTDVLACMVVYVSGGAWQLPNFLAAGLRYGFTFDAMYRGAEHERSAYAQTDLCIKLGKPWEELDALRDS